MKYLKKFEFSNPMTDDQKKLLSHIDKVFEFLGYDFYGYVVGGDTLSTDFYRKDRNNIIFEIKGEHSKSLIFLSISLRIGSLKDQMGKFVPEYFRTIDGLEIYSESKDWFNTTFQIVGDVNDIINQITVEDFKIKFEINKYNI